VEVNFLVGTGYILMAPPCPEMNCGISTVVKYATHHHGQNVARYHWINFPFGSKLIDK